MMGYRGTLIAIAPCQTVEIAKKEDFWSEDQIKEGVMDLMRERLIVLVGSGVYTAASNSDRVLEFVLIYYSM